MAPSQRTQRMIEKMHSSVLRNFIKSAAKKKCWLSYKPTT